MKGPDLEAAIDAGVVMPPSPCVVPSSARWPSVFSLAPRGASCLQRSSDAGRVYSIRCWSLKRTNVGLPGIAVSSVHKLESKVASPAIFVTPKI
jgi:hypothetical protein